jgi:membrane protease YdiL (CAAX protease family)
VTQYRPLTVLAIWVAAAVPMGVLSWVVAPAVFPGADLAVTLLAAQTVGLVWLFAIVVLLVAREQRTLRLAVVRDALWLRAPSDRSGRRGGRVWLWLVVFLLGYAVISLIPLDLPEPADRSFRELLTSPDRRDVLRGSWGLFALIVVMQLFNTVLGEELLFRGLLLPRMRGAFGRLDWVVNGVLFGLYHLHLPWSIPSATVAGVFLFAYPTRRFRSAWMGIAIHSAQSVVVVAVAFALVVAEVSDT